MLKGKRTLLSLEAGCLFMEVASRWSVSTDRIGKANRQHFSCLQPFFAYPRHVLLTSHMRQREKLFDFAIFLRSSREAARWFL